MTNTPPNTGQMQPPLNVEQIARQASEFEFDPFSPLRYWIRAAGLLIKEASIYEREGNDQQAYLLLFRHAQLVLSHIATHPDARQEDNRKAVAAAKREVQRNLSKLELLKPRINKRYERYVQLLRGREAKKTTSLLGSDGVATANAPVDPALAGIAEPLEAAQNKELAVKLAQREFNRRATARTATQTRDPYAKDILENYGVEDFHESHDDEPADDLSRRLQNIRSKVPKTQRVERRLPSTPDRPVSESQGDVQTAPIPQRLSDMGKLSSYKYPNIPRQPAFDIGQQPPPVPGKEPATSSSSLPPQLPAKVKDSISSPLESATSSPLPEAICPPIPKKGLLSSSTSATDDNVTPPADLQKFTFKPSAYLENGTPLRTIFISPDLRKQFLYIAASNTQRNLETCGILCGTLISNAFFISKLLIPEQESTSDTCEMVNEGAIFDYCDSEDLMVLGWIHTHPSQTCFMSSRDLHTHSGYQVMLAESIAIVCAPSKDPDWGVFRLTDPPGLKSVLACTQSGLFHPHPEPNIYTDALRPGHVFEAKGLAFEVVDLRR
ncbi:STAM-binding protein-like protein [Histoplasma capsulatum var. duboisii H88]|uniref:STAM-binding protein-like protein n=2 Tax=Ajellomyces capsulatus TaxID=5037 RepID=A0A8A1LR66_AJEC8|nr:endosome-associated ubiquitin isopeptidase [Histoplasma capsulatum H143]QSS56409.1 STAM-binding protein-like protein [Histoplasma capsulatum var. duboisii H88]